jgi:hypothetical protein
MEKLIFDDGLLRLDVNGNGILMFNPSDLNLYHRFTELPKKMVELENNYKKLATVISEDANEEETISSALGQLRQIDVAVKKELGRVFGEQNDFDDLFAGVNLMSVAKNGERVITNFLNAISPYIEKGVSKYAKDSAAMAVAQAKAARAKRQK